MSRTLVALLWPASFLLAQDPPADPPIPATDGRHCSSSQYHGRLGAGSSVIDVGTLGVHDPSKTRCREVPRETCEKAQAENAKGPTTGSRWQGGCESVSRDNCKKCYECTATGSITFTVFFDPMRSWMADKKGPLAGQRLNHERGHLQIALALAAFLSGDYSFTVASCDKEAAKAEAERLGKSEYKDRTVMRGRLEFRDQQRYEDETDNGDNGPAQRDWDRSFQEL